MTQATVVKRQILASKIAYKRSLNNEERLERELQRFFYKLKKEVLNALDKYWSDTLLLQGQVDLICAPVHEAHKEYYELLEKYIKREYRLGKAEGKRLVEIANSRAKTASKSERIPFTPRLKKTNDLFGTLPSAEERLLNKTFTASERTLARVDSQISQILTDGYRNGQGINSVANDLTARFDQLTTWESKRIARTEIHNAHNTAVMDTYEDMGVEYTMWMCANDDRVRDSHIEIDGEIIRVGDEYSNGLKFPGDTDGPLEEWINCRCANAPFVMPYGFMAPPFTPFRESDLVKIETKADNTPNQMEPTDITETSPTEAPTQPYIINGGERNSKVEITPEVLETVLKHKELRTNAKIEWGNLVDLKTGKLIHTKDIRGTAKGVKVPRPYTQNQFGLLHNHPAEAGFSGADMYNQLGYGKQGACFASTKDGLWIARDTEQGTFMKKEGIYDSIRYETRSKMNQQMRDIYSDLGDNKYNDLILKAESKEERDLLKKQYRTEVKETYNNWLLEEYGVGKNKANLFEIEFLTNEELLNVKF